MDLSDCRACKAALTCVGNTTLAYAMWRLALSNGWTPEELPSFLSGFSDFFFDERLAVKPTDGASPMAPRPAGVTASAPAPTEGSVLKGFEDLAEDFAFDTNLIFLGKVMSFTSCVRQAQGNGLAPT